MDIEEFRGGLTVAVASLQRGDDGLSGGEFYGVADGGRGCGVIFPAGEFIGELGGVDGVGGADYEGAFDDVFEFADIAWPVVIHEDFHGFRGDAGDVFVLEAVEAFDEVAGEEGDVLLAHSQGREFESDDIDAVEEVFAEASFPDHGGEVTVGGGDNPGVTGFGSGAAEGFIAVILKEAEQPHLEGGGDLADLIEEKCAVVGAGDEAVFILVGAGEGSLAVAEEFRFQEVVGYGAAVDGDEGMAFLFAGVMDGAGEEFLAGSGFAVDKDGGGAVGDHGEEFADLAHGGAVRDHVAELALSGEFLPQGLDFAEVAEGLGAADDIAVGIAQHGGGNADRDALTEFIDDVS